MNGLFFIIAIVISINFHLSSTETEVFRKIHFGVKIIIPSGTFMCGLKNWGYCLVFQHQIVSHHLVGLTSEYAPLCLHVNGWLAKIVLVLTLKGLTFPIYSYSLTTLRNIVPYRVHCYLNKTQIKQNQMPLSLFWTRPDPTSSWWDDFENETAIQEGLAREFSFSELILPYIERVWTFSVSPVKKIPC